MMIKRLLFLAFVAGLIAVFVVLLRPAPVAVDVAQVTIGDFSQQISEEGKTRPKEAYAITSPVTGTLMRVALKAGDPVTANQILATVLPRTSELLDVRAESILQARLGSVRAALAETQILTERAKVSYLTAQSEFARKVKLSTKGFVSETELEQDKLQVQLRNKELEAAKYKMSAASHDVDRALAQLKKSQYQPKQSSEAKLLLHSPINGQIIQVLRESQGSIKAGTEIMTVADLRELEIVVEMLSSQAVTIPKDAEVIIKRWGGSEDLKGRVRIVEPGGYTKVSALGIEEQRVNVVIDLISPYSVWENLGASYRVDTDIVIRKLSKQQLVPLSACFRDGESWAVFQVDEGRVRKRLIELSYRNQSLAVVKSGLAVNDTVVLYPSDRVRDGVVVKVR